MAKELPAPAEGMDDQQPYEVGVLSDAAIDALLELGRESLEVTFGPVHEGDGDDGDDDGDPNGTGFAYYGGEDLEDK